MQPARTTIARRVPCPRATTAASMDRDWSGCCDRQHQDFTWRCPLYVRCTVLKRGVVRRLFAVEQLVFRSEEHTSELQSLMRISYAVFCLKKKITNKQSTHTLHYYMTDTSKPLDKIH